RGAYLAGSLNGLGSNQGAAHEDLAFVIRPDGVGIQHVVGTLNCNPDNSLGFASHTENTLDKGAFGFHNYAFPGEDLLDNTLDIGVYLNGYRWFTQRDLPCNCRNHLDGPVNR